AVTSTGVTRIAFPRFAFPPFAFPTFAFTPFAFTPFAFTHDEAIPGAQAALPGLSSALPSRRLLRAVLRGRPRGRTPASNHADVAPEGCGSHSHGRHSPSCRRRLHHAMIRAGRKVAVCEQMEAPVKGKKLVRRE